MVSILFLLTQLFIESSLSAQLNYCSTFRSVPVRTQYYVSSDPNVGSDTNIGTIDEPFKTIDRALCVLGPGKTLLIRAGFYGPIDGSKIPNGEINLIDPEAGYVVLRAYRAPQSPNAERVIIQASAETQTVPSKRPLNFPDTVIFPNPRPNPMVCPDVVNNPGSLAKEARHHIKFENLIFDGRDGMNEAIKLHKECGPFSNNIHFSGGEIRFARNQGILGHCDNCTIKLMNIHSNGTESGVHGLYLSGENFNILSNNIYRNFHMAIRNSNLPHASIRNNNFFENGTEQFETTVEMTSRDGKLYDNVFYKNNTTIVARVRNSSDLRRNQFIENKGTAISVATVPGNLPNPGSAVNIEKNVLSQNIDIGIFLDRTAFDSVSIIDNEADQNRINYLLKPGSGVVTVNNKDTITTTLKNISDIIPFKIKPFSVATVNANSDGDATVNLEVFFENPVPPSGHFNKFRWDVIREPVVGAASIADRTKSKTTVNVSEPGSYLFRVIAESPSESVSALKRVYSYSNHANQAVCPGVIRIEAEESDFSNLKTNKTFCSKFPGSPTSSMAPFIMAPFLLYDWDACFSPNHLGSNLDTLKGRFPGVSGTYKVFAASYDISVPAGKRVPEGRLLISRIVNGFPDKAPYFDTRDTWILNGDNASLPGYPNYSYVFDNAHIVRHELGTVNILRGDEFSVDGYSSTSSGGPAWFNLDYLEFVPTNLPASCPSN